MPADAMNPATAVTWGPFIQAASEQFASEPGQVSPAAIANMPAGYTLVRTMQMTDSFGPVQSRVFYGFVAVGGAPQTAVVALRGTATTTEWWDDFQWDLVPFGQVRGGGNVAQGFRDIYSTFGTMTPGQQQGAPAPATFAADVAQAATAGLVATIAKSAWQLVSGRVPSDDSERWVGRSPWAGDHVQINISGVTIDDETRRAKSSPCLVEGRASPLTILPRDGSRALVRGGGWCPAALDGGGYIQSVRRYCAAVHRRRTSLGAAHPRPLRQKAGNSPSAMLTLTEMM